MSTGSKVKFVLHSKPQQTETACLTPVQFLCTGMNLLLLCLLVAGELYFNVQFYSDHDHDELFLIALTKEAMDKFSEAGSRVEAVKVEALVACTRYERSSFIHFLGLASVVSRPVHSVYPDVNLRYQMLIHRSLYPRTSPTSFQPLEIPPRSWFEPNHFVPLISKKEELTTCPKKQEIKDCNGQKTKQQATLSSFLMAKPTGESSQASKSTCIGSPSGQKRTAAAAR